MLRVTDLTMEFTSGRRAVRAVDHVSLQVAAGKTHGIVGESGSGKTTVGLTLMRLHEASGGEVLFSGSAAGFLIGPEDEYWDHVLLVRQASKAAFLAFASDPQAVMVTAHRTAAVADSRLLPCRPERTAGN